MQLFNENSLKQSFFISRLKHTDRSGWVQLNIPKENVESVADHISSSIELLNRYNKQYNLNLNIEKIIKIIMAKELPKALEDGEQSVVNNGQKRDTRKELIWIIENFGFDKELLDLYDESVLNESEEAKYALMITKFESDIQAVNYYQQGLLTMDNVLEDIEGFDDKTRNQILEVFEKYPIPCLSWLIFDSRYYKGNELFTTLSNELIDYCKNTYELTNNTKKL